MKFVFILLLSISLSLEMNLNLRITELQCSPCQGSELSKCQSRCGPNGVVKNCEVCNYEPKFTCQCVG